MMKLNVVSSISVLLFSASLLGACGGSDTGGGGGSGGAPAGEGGAGGIPACYGNEAAWMAAIATPIACQVNSDCCVIVNGCTNAAQVVSKTKLSTAKADWPYCDNECTFCVAPAVQVECVNMECVGFQLPDDPSTPDALRKDHCGMDGPPSGMMNPGAQFVCGG